MYYVSGNVVGRFKRSTWTDKVFYWGRRPDFERLLGWVISHTGHSVRSEGLSSVELQKLDG